MMPLTFGHKQPEKFFFVSFKKTAMLQSGKGLLLVIRKKSFSAVSALVLGCKTVLPKFSSQIVLLKAVASTFAQNTRFGCSGNIMLGRFKSVSVRPRYLF